jgi:hypothetical protein
LGASLRLIAFDIPAEPLFLAATGVVGAIGEIDNVSHAFQPDGRLQASNSP